MLARVTYLFIGAFWITMNVLLWRAEYGRNAGEMPVPTELVWRKLLTAPDVSPLTIYQHGRRIGFCQFSTGVEQAMAALDENTVPAEGVATQGGYQIHANGNLSLGAVTNRVRFDGRVEFSSTRVWRELNLKVTTWNAGVDIHSVAAERTIHFKITSEGENFDNVLSFADLQNPAALLRALGADAGGFADFLDLPAASASPSPLADTIQWQAHRDRLLIGREPVTAYCLETSAFDHPIVIYVGSLGEILRIEMPGGLTAVLEEWNRL